MRIAVISNLLPPHGLGGAERYVARLARALSDRHEVMVLSGSRPVRLGRATVHRISSRPAIGPSFARKAWWHLADQWSPNVYRDVRRYLRRFQPDVVAVHSPQGLSAAVFTAARDCGIPIVHTLHDYNALCVRTSFYRGGSICGRDCAECRLQRAVRSRAISSSKVIVGRSRYLLAVHAPFVVSPTTTLTVNYPGVRLPRLARASRHGASPTVGFIGTLGNHKGLRFLLETWDHAPRAWRLVVAGSGPLEAYVTDTARRKPNVEYRGEVGGADKEAFFAELGALVVPSLWEEPFGQVGIEALVRGVPLVASRIGGLAEIPLARLFEPGDRDDLLASLGDVLEEGARDEYARRALEERERWSEPRNLREQEQLLEAAARDG